MGRLRKTGTSQKGIVCHNYARNDSFYDSLLSIYNPLRYSIPAPSNLVLIEPFEQENCDVFDVKSKTKPTHRTWETSRSLLVDTTPSAQLEEIDYATFASAFLSEDEAIAATKRHNQTKKKSPLKAVNKSNSPTLVSSKVFHNAPTRPELLSCNEDLIIDDKATSRIHKSIKTDLIRECMSTSAFSHKIGNQVKSLPEKHFAAVCGVIMTSCSSESKSSSGLSKKTLKDNSVHKKQSKNKSVTSKHKIDHHSNNKALGYKLTTTKLLRPPDTNDNAVVSKKKNGRPRSQENVKPQKHGKKQNASPKSKVSQFSSTIDRRHQQSLNTSNLSVEEEKEHKIEKPKRKKEVLSIDQVYEDDKKSPRLAGNVVVKRRNSVKDDTIIPQADPAVCKICLQKESNLPDSKPFFPVENSFHMCERCLTRCEKLLIKTPENFSIMWKPDKSHESCICGCECDLCLLYKCISSFSMQILKSTILQSKRLSQGKAICCVCNNSKDLNSVKSMLKGGGTDQLFFYKFQNHVVCCSLCIATYKNSLSDVPDIDSLPTCRKSNKNRCNPSKCSTCLVMRCLDKIPRELCLDLPNWLPSVSKPPPPPSESSKGKTHSTPHKSPKKDSVRENSRESHLPSDVDPVSTLVNKSSKESLPEKQSTLTTKMNGRGRQSSDGSEMSNHLIADGKRIRKPVNRYSDSDSENDAPSMSNVSTKGIRRKRAVSSTNSVSNNVVSNSNHESLRVSNGSHHSAVMKSGPRVKQVSRSHTSGLDVNDDYGDSSNMDPCGKCRGCNTYVDCGFCDNCGLMRKYGGPGTTKFCIDRICQRLATTSSLSTKRKGGPRVKYASVERRTLHSTVPNLPEQLADCSMLQAKACGEQSDEEVANLDNEETERIKPVLKEVIDSNLAHDGGFPVVTTPENSPQKEICYSCGSGGANMLFCVSCAEPFHFYCVDRQFRPKRKDHFVCRNCTTCFKCRGPGSDLRCFKCCKGFHPDCLQDYLPARSVERSAFLCPDCATCLHCGVKASTIGVTEWSHQVELCATCAASKSDGNVCPECSRAYSDSTMQMIECDKCAKWVHRHCAKLSKDQYEMLSHIPENNLSTCNFFCSKCLSSTPATNTTSSHKGERDNDGTELRELAQKTLMERMSTFVSGLSSEERELVTRQVEKEVTVEKVNQKAHLPQLDGIFDNWTENETCTIDRAPAPPILPNQSTHAYAYQIPRPNTVFNVNVEHSGTSSSFEHELDISEESVADSNNIIENNEYLRVTHPGDNTQDLHLYNPNILSEKSSILNDMAVVDEEVTLNHQGIQQSSKFFLPNNNKTNSRWAEMTQKLRQEEEIEDLVNRTVTLQSDVEELLDQQTIGMINTDPKLTSLVLIIQNIVARLLVKIYHHRGIQSHTRLTYEHLLRKVEENAKLFFPWIDTADLIQQTKSLVNQQEGHLKNILAALEENRVKELEEEVNLMNRPDVNKIEALLSKKFCRDDNRWMRFWSEKEEQCVQDFESKRSKVRQSDYSPSDMSDWSSAHDPRHCILCHRLSDYGWEGRLIYCGQDVWVHINCAIWSNEVYEEENGLLINLYEAIQRSRNTRCSFCSKRGATLACCYNEEEACDKTMHFSCALRKGGVFTSSRNIYCSKKHAELQEEERILPAEDLLVCRRVMVCPETYPVNWTNPVGQSRSIQFDKGVKSVDIVVTIGALRIESMGKLYEASDSVDPFLIPVQYRCRRIFWSTSDLDERCSYYIHTEQVLSSQQAKMSNISIVHGSTSRNPQIKPLTVNQPNLSMSSKSSQQSLMHLTKSPPFMGSRQHLKPLSTANSRDIKPLVHNKSNVPVALKKPLIQPHTLSRIDPPSALNNATPFPEVDLDLDSPQKAPTREEAFELPPMRPLPNFRAEATVQAVKQVGNVGSRSRHKYIHDLETRCHQNRLSGSGNAPNDPHNDRLSAALETLKYHMKQIGPEFLTQRKFAEPPMLPTPSIQREQNRVSNNNNNTLISNHTTLKRPTNPSVSVVNSDLIWMPKRSKVPSILEHHSSSADAHPTPPVSQWSSHAPNTSTSQLQMVANLPQQVHQVKQQFQPINNNSNPSNVNIQTIISSRPTTITTTNGQRFFIYKPNQPVSQSSSQPIKVLATMPTANQNMIRVSLPNSNPIKCAPMFSKAPQTGNSNKLKQDLDGIMNNILVNKAVKQAESCAKQPEIKKVPEYRNDSSLLENDNIIQMENDTAPGEMDAMVLRPSPTGSHMKSSTPTGGQEASPVLRADVEEPPSNDDSMPIIQSVFTVPRQIIQQPEQSEEETQKRERNFFSDFNLSQVDGSRDQYSDTDDDYQSEVESCTSKHSRASKTSLSSKSSNYSRRDRLKMIKANHSLKKQSQKKADNKLLHRIKERIKSSDTENNVSGPMKKPQPRLKKWIQERENQRQLEIIAKRAKQFKKQRLYRKEAEVHASRYCLKFVVDGFADSYRDPKSSWKKVIDLVRGLRKSQGLPGMIAPCNEAWTQMGLNHPHLVYLIEQMVGAFHCYRYKFIYHTRKINRLRELFTPPEPVPEGCIRAQLCIKARQPSHLARDSFDFLLCKANMPPTTRRYANNHHNNAEIFDNTNLTIAAQFRELISGYLSRCLNVNVYRSKIHSRGLFALRDFAENEMISEYLGELIRSSVCEVRERRYREKGVDCYMFRVDYDWVIDATRKGNVARFINHSCQPNCYAKVCTIDGEKHIIIFASRRIYRTEELTYDYRFPKEDDKLLCNCGALNCRRYLN